MKWLNQKNKYSAKKTTYNGRLYDSKLEASVARDIDILIKAKVIRNVVPQVDFILYGKGGTKICVHKVDFMVEYTDGKVAVIEAKGVATALFRLKHKLFLDNHPDIDYILVTSKQPLITNFK